MPVDVKALLKQVPSVAYLYGALAVMAVSGVTYYNHVQREIGKRDLLLASSRAEIKDWKHKADSLAKVYRIDTVRLTRLRVATDTLTQTVEVWKRDTVKVVEYVTKADSALKACTQVIGTCEARGNALQNALNASEKANRLLKASMPSKLAPWRQAALGAIAGYLVFRVTK